MQGAAFLEMFRADRRMLDIASKCKKPDAVTLATLRKAVTDAAAPIFLLKAKRDCTHPNHAAGTADAVPAFVWVNLDVGPLDTITMARESSDFFLNKVRKESKDKSLPAYMQYANLIRDALGAVFDFAKENFKSGLAFNPKGVEYSVYAAWRAEGAAPAAAAAAAGGAGASEPAAAAAAAAAAAPHPAAAAPPAVPAGAGAAATAAAAAGGAGGKDPAALQSALFAQLGAIDQSSGRTAGLRHVTKDMKASAVNAAAAAGEAAPVAVKAVAPPPAARSKDEPLPTGEARVALVDKRWYVEFQQAAGAQIHVPEAAKMTEEVYIYACKDCAIFVDTKVKGVRVDKCRNITIIMQSVLSGVEAVNCKKLKMQVMRDLPSVAIDKTDGVVVGLSWTARAAQIVTSKSSEMNVTFPVSAAEDAEWVEMPIPEQFVTRIVDGKLVSSVSDLYTH